MNHWITDNVVLTYRDDADDTALLTARGKDHDLTVAELAKLRDACSAAIETLLRKPAQSE